MNEKDLKNIHFREFSAYIQALEKINTLKAQQNLLLSQVQNLSLQEQMLTSKADELMAFMQKELPRIRAQDMVLASRIYQSYLDLLNQKNQINLEILKLKADIQNIQQQITNIESVQIPQIQQSLKTEIASYVQNLINQGAIPGFQSGGVESIEIFYDKGYAKVVISGQIIAYGFMVVDGAIHPVSVYTVGKETIYVDLVTGQVYPTEPQPLYNFPDNFKFVTYLGSGPVLASYDQLKQEYKTLVEKTLTDPKTINDIVNQLKLQIQQQLLDQLKQQYSGMFFNERAVEIAGQLGINADVQFIGYSIKDNKITYYFQLIVHDIYISPYPAVYNISISYDLNNLVPGQAIQPQISVNYDLQKTLQYWSERKITNTPLPVEGMGDFLGKSYLEAFISKILQNSGINGKLQFVGYDPELNIITTTVNLPYGNQTLPTVLIFNVIPDKNNFQIQLSDQSKRILQFQQVYNYLYFNTPKIIADTLNINENQIGFINFKYDVSKNQFISELMIPVPDLSESYISRPVYQRINISYDVIRNENGEISIKLSDDSLTKLQYISLLYKIPILTTVLQNTFYSTLNIEPYIQFQNLVYLGNKEWQLFYTVDYNDKRYTISLFIDKNGNISVQNLEKVIQDIYNIKLQSEAERLLNEFDKNFLYNLLHKLTGGLNLAYYLLNEIEFKTFEFFGTPIGSDFWKYYEKKFVSNQNVWEKPVEGLKVATSFFLGLGEGIILPIPQFILAGLSFLSNIDLNLAISSFAKEHGLTKEQEELLRYRIYKEIEEQIKSTTPTAYHVLNNPGLSSNPIISAFQIAEMEFRANPFLTVGLFLPAVADFVSLASDISKFSKFETFNLRAIRILENLEKQGWKISKIHDARFPEFTKLLKDFGLETEINRLSTKIELSLFDEFLKRWEDMFPKTSPFKSPLLMEYIYNKLKTTQIFSITGDELGRLHYLKFTKNIIEESRPVKIDEYIGYFVKNNLEYPYYSRITRIGPEFWENYSVLKFYIPKSITFTPRKLSDLVLYGKVTQELQSLRDLILKNVYHGTEESTVFFILKIRRGRVEYVNLFKQTEIIGYLDKIKSKVIDFKTLKEKTKIQYNYLDYYESGKDAYLRLRMFKDGFNIDLGEVKIKYLKPFFRSIKAYINGLIDFKEFKNTVLREYVLKNRYKIAEELFVIRAVNPYLYNTLIKFLNEKFGDLFKGLIPQAKREFKPLKPFPKIEKSADVTKITRNNLVQIIKTKDLSQKVMDETAFYGTRLELIDKMRMLAYEELKYSQIPYSVKLLRFKSLYSRPELSKYFISPRLIKLSLFGNIDRIIKFTLPKDLSKINKIDLSNRLLLHQKVSSKVDLSQKVITGTRIKLSERIRLKELEQPRLKYELQPPEFKFNFRFSLPSPGRPPKPPEQYYYNRRKYVSKHGWYEEKRYIAMLITKLLTTNRKTYKRSHKRRK
ncbi:MAG: hypothetical protein ACP5IB_06640 [Thermoplasmata archaeon]